MFEQIIPIGDVHGLETWKSIVNEHPDCRIVFLGDYCDPYCQIDDENVVQNLEEIINAKKAEPERIVLLVGNHDLHYIYKDKEPCSRFNPNIREKLHEIFEANKELFLFAYEESGLLFTHAGITEEWFVKVFRGDKSKSIADQINGAKGEQFDSLFMVSYFRGGVAEYSGPFWTDIHEMVSPLKGTAQVVGHNRVENVVPIKADDNTVVIFCDCLWNDHFVALDTTK